MAKPDKPNKPDLSSFKDQRDILREINAEIGKQNSAVKEAAKSYSNLESIAYKLQNSEEQITDLNEKQLKALKSKAQIALRELKFAADRLKTGKILTAQEKAILQAKKDSFKVESDFVKKVTEELDAHIKITKQLGLTGGILKGISKIPILGDVFDANEALDAARKKVQETGSGVKGLGAAFKNIGGQITGGLLNPANMVLGTMVFIGKTIMDIDKSAGDLAKNMNVSYDQALQINEEFRDMAVSSGNTSLSGKKLSESLTAINNSLGTAGKLSKEDLVTFTALREQAGMTNDEILAMQKYSMATGGSLKENVESFQAAAKSMSYQKGVALNTKKLMADMANVSNRTKLSIEGGVKGLAKAAVAAKLMGGDLGKVANVADKLLNFESSIESELSAELLLGKDLNLEKARSLALNNDMAGVAEEITNQAGSAAEFSKMNRIQQDAMAEAVGMSADELADMLVEQEALKKVGRSLNEEEQKAFEAAKDKYGVEEASNMLKEGGLEKMLQQQSTTEKLANAVERIQELFVSMIDGPLGSMLSIIGNILSNATALKTVFALISGAMLGKMVFGLAASAMSMRTQLISARAYQSTLSATASKETAIAAAKVAGAEASTLGAATPLIIGGIAAVLGAVAMFSMKDGVIDAKKGPVMSGEFGSVQLDPKDKAMYGADGKIKVGTNLGGGTKSSGGSTQVNVDMAQTNALLQQLISITSAGGDVVLDGQKVGQALNLSSYKTQ